MMPRYRWLGLHRSLSLAARPGAAGLVALLAACGDPPAPSRPPSPNGSTAPWVEWRSASDPVRGPVVVVRDRPGGPMDQLVADPDVTTFLNDRFHALFEPGNSTRPPGTITFYDGCGCLLAGPVAPSTPASFIAVANGVIVRPESAACQGHPYRDACPDVTGNPHPVAPRIRGAD